ncbi:MAG: SH3 domain-containing protein [Chloroflexota bacterium]
MIRKFPIVALAVLGLMSLACNLGAIPATITPTLPTLIPAIATTGPTVEPTFTSAAFSTLASGNPTTLVTGGVTTFATPAAGVCPVNLPPRLIGGQGGRVTPGQPNAIRTQPTRNNAVSQIIGQIPAGATFSVLAGPYCSDGYAWWQVTYNGITGWTPEGQDTTYWLEPVFNTTPACPGTLPSRLVVGGIGRVMPGLDNAIRSGPGKTTTTVIGSIPAGGVFNIIAGPQCADGYTWWQVTYSGVTGWTPEGEGSTYWLEPLSSSTTLDCPGSPPTRLVVGSYARVNPGDPNVIRSGPAKTGTTVVGQIPSGGTFLIMGYPGCADNLLWWKVNYNGTIGWTAEGQGNTYWVEPIITSDCLGSPISRLVVGSKGRVTTSPGTPNALRSLPSKSTGSVIGQIPAGRTFDILGGPQCADSFRWWQVRYAGTVGWTADGQGTTYWLEPYLP